jgi:hypothetical protein
VGKYTTSASSKNLGMKLEIPIPELLPQASLIKNWHRSYFTSVLKPVGNAYLLFANFFTVDSHAHHLVLITFSFFVQTPLKVR